MEADGGSARIRAAQSALVTLPTLGDKQKRARQFQLALRALKLEPFVHKSQLTEPVSFETGHKPEQTSEPVGKDASGRLEKTNGNLVLCITCSQLNADALSIIDKMEWPQLVLLANAEWDW